MQLEQITHLREAAKDIRLCLDDILKEAMEEGLTSEDEIALRKIERLSKNAERALTRIEMCLKEIS